MRKFNVFKALERALRLETSVFDTYIKFSKEANDAEVSALFRQIADDEKIHKELLSLELQALKETQQEQTKRPSYWMELVQKDSDSDLPKKMRSEEIQRYFLSCKRVNKILKEANDQLLQKQIRQEQELAIASEIQNSLLPKELPQKSGLEISAINMMARDVGGDYYDCVSNPSGQLALVIADVMGKGLPASLLMTTVRAIWRCSVMKEAKSPDDTLNALNHVLYSDFRSTKGFVTMFSVLYDPSTLTFKYGNGGHNYPLYLTQESDEFEELDTDGIPIGIMPDSKYFVDERILSKGDLIVMYTDGIVEAEREDELFGIERLKELIIQNRTRDVEEIQNKIISAVKEYSGSELQADDITLMVLRVTE